MKLLTEAGKLEKHLSPIMLPPFPRNAGVLTNDCLI